MKYFGTDGIRRDGGFFDDRFLSLFAAAVAALPSCKRVVLGRDTRPTGERIERSLALLFSSYGIETLVAGILPSPALAFCVKRFACDYGVMITASHNPPCDNGLKLFDATGAKIPEKTELLLEERLRFPLFIPHRKTDVLFVDGRKTYLDFLLYTHATDLRGKRILLDCAYGAASELAAPLFRALGAEVVAVCDEKAGEKINVDCGATHPENLFDPSSRFDLAFSYDGDADRVLCVQNKTLYDGDDISFCFAQVMKERKTLRNSGVCGTILTNSGYEKAYSEKSVFFFRADVGDRNVFKTMSEHDLSLGAETSGHVIFSDVSSTGDGILTSLLLAILDKEYGLPSFVRVQKLPSLSRSVPVTEKEKESFRRLQKGNGLPSFPGVYTVVRASGTENKIRFLCESEREEDALRALNELERTVREALR